MLVEHLSYTAVSMLSRCPRQFWYRYVLGLKIPPNAAMSFGSTYHHTQEQNFLHKMESGKDFSVGQVSAVFSDQWNIKAGEVDWSFEEDDKGELKDIGVGLVTKYVEEIAPHRFPVEIEKEFDLTIPEVSRSFTGRIDFVGPDDLLLEHKTAGKKWPFDRANSTDQVEAYYLAYYLEEGRWPTSFLFDVAVKTKVPQHQALVTHRNNNAILAYIDRLKTAERLIDAEVFPRTDPTNWYCGAKYCGYYDHCMRGISLNRLRLMENREDDLDDAI